MKPLPNTCPKCGSDDFDVSRGPDDGITWISLIRCYCYKCKKIWLDVL